MDKKNNSNNSRPGSREPMLVRPGSSNVLPPITPNNKGDSVRPPSPDSPPTFAPDRLDSAREKEKEKEREKLPFGIEKVLLMFQSKRAEQFGQKLLTSLEKLSITPEQYILSKPDVARAAKMISLMAQKIAQAEFSITTDPEKTTTSDPIAGEMFVHPACQLVKGLPSLVNSGQIEGLPLKEACELLIPELIVTASNCDNYAFRLALLLAIEELDSLLLAAPAKPLKTAQSATSEREAQGSTTKSLPMPPSVPKGTQRGLSSTATLNTTTLNRASKPTEMSNTRPIGATTSLSMLATNSPLVRHDLQFVKAVCASLALTVANGESSSSSKPTTPRTPASPARDAKSLLSLIHIHMNFLLAAAQSQEAFVVMHENGLAPLLLGPIMTLSASTPALFNDVLDLSLSLLASSSQPLDPENENHNNAVVKTCSLVVEAMERKDSSLQQKYQRNELIILVSVLVDAGFASAVTSSGVLSSAIKACASIYGHVSLSHKRVVLSSSSVDFEFSKLILTMTTSLCTVAFCEGNPKLEAAIAHIISKDALFKYFFSFIERDDFFLNGEPPAQTSSSTSALWTVAQLEELLLMTLDSITVMAPMFLAEYTRYLGNTRFLQLFARSCGTSTASTNDVSSNARLFRGAGNAFYSTGEFKNMALSATLSPHPSSQTMPHPASPSKEVADYQNGRRSYTLMYLKVLLQVCLHPEGGSSIARDIVDQGGLEMLVKYALQGCALALENATFISMDALTRAILEHVFLLLSELVASFYHYKSLFAKSGGIGLIVDALSLRCVVDEEDLLLPLCDLVWNGVVGNAQNEALFLEKKGVYHYMNAMERVYDAIKTSPDVSLTTQPRVLGGMMLSCLRDFLENAKVVRHVAEWRSDSDPSFGPLRMLLAVWQSETISLGVDGAPRGVLVDKICPLEGSQGSDGPINELASNHRVKVYAVLDALGFASGSENKPEVLSVTEKVILETTREYLTLKRGEVWDAIQQAAALEGLNLIPTDQECLTNSLEHHHVFVRSLIDRQTQLLALDDQEALEDERQAYISMTGGPLLRKGKGSTATLKEFDEAVFHNFVKRTSNSHLLKEAHSAQKTQIEGSRTPLQLSDVLHEGVAHVNHILEFYPKNLNTTAFGNRSFKASDDISHV